MLALLIGIISGTYSLDLQRRPVAGRVAQQGRPAARRRACGSPKPPTRNVIAGPGRRRDPISLPGFELAPAPAPARRSVESAVSRTCHPRDDDRRASPLGVSRAPPPRPGDPRGCPRARPRHVRDHRARAPRHRRHRGDRALPRRAARTASTTRTCSPTRTASSTASAGRSAPASGSWCSATSTRTASPGSPSWCSRSGASASTRCRTSRPGVDEGHGLSTAAVDAAARDGVALIVTVDTGSTSVAEAAAAAGHGIDVIITDHHHLPEVLPGGGRHRQPAARRLAPTRIAGLSGSGRRVHGGAAAPRRPARRGGGGAGPRGPRDDRDGVGRRARSLGENRAIARLGLERMRTGAAAGDRGAARARARGTRRSTSRPWASCSRRGSTPPGGWGRRWTPPGCCSPGRPRRRRRWP